MIYILHIETSHALCSVALSQNEICIADCSGESVNDHAAQLTLLIDEVIQKVGITLQLLSAIAISEGPGSYTGLRIGASVAKGICFALTIPLIAVGTLQAMVNGAQKDYPDKQYLFCPLIDARRMEVYTALYDSRQTVLNATHALIVENDSFRALLHHHQIVFFGSGLQKIKDFLIHPHAILYEEFKPQAKHLIEIAFAQFIAKSFCNLSTFEPNYVKPFYTTAVPKANN